ncbi:serine/threonine-protein phosphatase 7 long form homolog [Quercus suber]|uniref:serine/threonine-protein phosphatase 7 long form homolog n=1 Tax=Quercus suber TaxID=58331 RepID=UPI0032DFD505
MFRVLALLFGNKSQSKLHCCFLNLLDDFGKAGEYSWGSATLAFLYKELCIAAIQKSMEIAGPVFILQLWAWEHLPYLTPIPINPINLNGNEPYCCRWDARRTFTHTPTHVLHAYRSNHDTQYNEQVVWTPYDNYLHP